MEKRARVGVDVGGTFTDICLIDDRGEVFIEKVPSTPSDPSQGILHGLSKILASVDVDISKMVYFGHGTTVATNTLLELRAASPGLITGDGFRDLLEIGRQTRPHLYDLQVDKIPALIPRHLRLEVTERVAADATVIRALDRDQVRQAVRQLLRAGVRSIAVCFLHSYLYPDHERQVRDIALEEDPELLISLSHEIVPEFREFERLSTTVINAYLQPRLKDYVRALRDRLRAQGYQGPAYITRSNGGVSSLDDSSLHPVNVLLSGPSTGVVGAAQVAQLAGIADIITFDVGGTSTDVSLVSRGQVSVTIGREIGGYHVQGPVVDVNTVGAGGGSIAWVDQGRVLKVGPMSAGADPGPACYGRGGQFPTVTDAHIVLGTLNPDYLLGGAVQLDAGASHRVMDRLASELGMSTLAVARGVISVILSNTTRAVRTISIRRGFDPREFTLVPFGGGGPLHASLLAREMGIPRVLVPKSPGILCAYGLLVTDLREDFSRTQIMPAEASIVDQARSALDELDAQAEAWLDAQNIARRYRLKRWFVDMRYKGQNYELRVPVPRGPFDAEALKSLLERFHGLHELHYGHYDAGEPAQLVTFRVEAVGTMPREASRSPYLNGQHVGRLADARLGSRTVHLFEESAEWPVYARARLGPGSTITGPAIVEQLDTTTVVLPGQYADVDAFENLVINESTPWQATPVGAATLADVRE